MAGNDIEVSIIIPTYNRVELLEFTLLSLYEQSIPAKNFEVIVVDDCSTDQTAKVLREMQPPYQLVHLLNQSNRGAAYSRNQGIKSSKGKIIIFMDEMLVDRDFIAGHLRYHQQENMVVTTHFNGQRIFTHYYQNFSKEQKRKFKINSMRMNDIRHATAKKGVLCLFSREKVINHCILRYGFKVRILPKRYKTLQNAYGMYLERMATPWFLFITNGLSVSRQLLAKTGLFDEKLKSWMEDWELGYRLYLAGATFYNAKDIACYHQSHPIGRSIKDKLKSYLYFAEKYPAIEILLLPALSAIFHWPVEKLGKIITQYLELEKTAGIHYREFILAFRDLGETLHWHTTAMVSDRALPLINSPAAGFARWEPIFAGKVKEQLAQLERKSFSSGNYRQLIKGFKELLHLPIREKSYY